jgi:hypothetical protein
MKFTLFTFLCAFGLSICAQPTLSLIVEEISIPEPEASNIAADLGDTPHTWRVYANFDADYELQIIYGDFLDAMSLTTTGAYYQHPAGGPTTLSFNVANFIDNPELAYDSWFTIGAEDNTANLIMVLPLGIYDGWENGDDILIDDIVGGGVFITTAGGNPQNQPDAEGNVLIAQITSSGTVTGCVNMQLRRLNPDGTLYDPPGPETSEVYQFTNMCFTLEAAGSCPADFDGSGFVAVPDLLAILSEYGCNSGCTKDLTGDDDVDTGDLLAFLSVFGTQCN